MEREESTESRQEVSYTLRNHQLGDMGYITYLHAIHVATAYGWGEPFEAMVGEITSNFQKNYNPKRERCIIAEKKGEIIGCVFLVDAGDNVAKLRLLYVSPEARGLGLAQALVNEVIKIAEQIKYDKMVLWTTNVLDAARYIYRKAGFELVHEEPNKEFGEELIGETWERKLNS
jgi:GNAT superfamily N-acetyltransferase